jgi:hypothetical protein
LTPFDTCDLKPVIVGKMEMCAEPTSADMGTPPIGLSGLAMLGP